MKIAKGGEVIVTSSSITTLIILLLNLLYNYTFLKILLIISIVFTSFMLFFFRDPEREIAEGIVSPADGRIMEIEKVNDEVLGEAYVISIFMSPFDVHVVRAPISGKVVTLLPLKGRHLPAFSKGYRRNERLLILMDNGRRKIKLMLIVGMLARRIMPYVKEGDVVEKGQRIGIIRFGSRVDIYIPCSMMEKLLVKKSLHLKAGEDRIA
ncbi:MAG: phosphatidylserine decarboxylase family protein [Thermoplasmata archaeon]|nr:MAG: phosphatidylserine decarboxylase family protein [Thermoplasmata archaeon]